MHAHRYALGIPVQEVARQRLRLDDNGSQRPPKKDSFADPDLAEWRSDEAGITSPFRAGFGAAGRSPGGEAPKFLLALGSLVCGRILWSSATAQRQIVVLRIRSAPRPWVCDPEKSL